MKTFEQWRFEWMQKATRDMTSMETMWARNGWTACDQQWREELAKDRGVLSFEEWFAEMEEEYGHLKSPAPRFAKKAWVKVEQVWRHKCLNLEQASQMKIAILERQIEEMKKDLGWSTSTLLHTHWTPENANTTEQIRQRHGLDEVKV